MKYRVVFRERFNAQGEQTENPPEFLDSNLTDGVVLDCEFVERTKPNSLHVQDVMDEDDSWQSVGTEVWTYDVADEREQEFVDAMEASQMVVEYDRLDDAPSLV